MGITCYMIRPTARFMYWHQPTMARPSQMAIRSPEHKCPSEDSRQLWGRSAAVVGPLFLAQSGILSPPSPPRLNSPYPSSMRTRAADRLLLGMRGAAPEEGAGTARPSEIASRDPASE